MQKAADLYADRSTAMIVDAETNLQGDGGQEADRLHQSRHRRLPGGHGQRIDQLATDLGVSPELLAKFRGI